MKTRANSRWLRRRHQRSLTGAREWRSGNFMHGEHAALMARLERRIREQTKNPQPTK